MTLVDIMGKKITYCFMHHNSYCGLSITIAEMLWMKKHLLKSCIMLACAQACVQVTVCLHTFVCILVSFKEMPNI